MNLNKTEKLLAARKKLKEFQRNKKIHAHDGSEEQSPYLQTSSDIQNEIERGAQMEDDRASAEYSTDAPCSVNMDVKGIAVGADVSASVSERETINNNVFDEPANIGAGSTAGRTESTANDTTSSHPGACRDLTKRAEVHFMEEPPVVQKEHLLQMASTVKDVLTEVSSEEQIDSLGDESSSVNQILNRRIAEQTQVENRLHVQVARYSSRISELEAILATKEAEYEAKLAREISPLKEQLQAHARTTGILIAEKAELTAALAQCRADATRGREETEELIGKLKSCQARVTDLEKETALYRSNYEDARKAVQQAQIDYDALRRKYIELKKANEDLDLEVSELRQKLNLKNTELIGAQQELEEKSALLSLNELRIQQLTNTSQEVQALEGQHLNATMLEQQLARTRDALKAVTEEKDEAGKQYQSYVRQLDAQHEKLLNELENGRAVIGKLEEKEQSYIERLSDLEKQLQQERERVSNLLTLEDQKDRVEALTRSVDELVSEQERLHVTLSEKDTEIAALTKLLQEAKDGSEQRVEASKLARALESEQLGAARAVSQNQQLKQQLNEMHDAFVLLSNAKLDLTEQLQAERSIGRKLNAQLDKVENEAKRLQDLLKEKDRQLTELEKEKLQSAQIADQIQHYQAQSHHAHTLQQELKNALASVEILKRENARLVERLNAALSEQSDRLPDSVESRTTESNDEATAATAATAAAAASASSSSSSSPKGGTRIATCSKEVQCESNLAAEGGEVDQQPANLRDPVQKLEERFKETMERVAELTDEKQRLEHLVLQLQSETETIGEYITLYQRQRAVLQERTKKRDEDFRQLLQQRNQQQEQLHKLKTLLIDLMKKKPESRSEPNALLSNSTEDANNGTLANNEKQEASETFVARDDETTSQILDLLTEIKDCEDTGIAGPDLHSCPWCSGKLITV